MTVTQEDKFIPGTNIQIAWSASSIGDFKQCPRLYYYKKIMGWKEREESVHLRFGSEYHTSLEEYDALRNIGNGHEDAIRIVLRDLLTRTFDWKSEHQYKNRPNLIRTVIWYLDQFKDDPAKTYVLGDGNPATEIEFCFALDWGPITDAEPYLLYGILDRIVDFADDIYGMDRKTTKSQPSSFYFSQYAPDNQMSMYTLACQVVYQSPIKGMIIDVAQVGVGFSRFGRGITYRTREQIQEWINDLRYWLAQAKLCADTNYWPQNDKSCSSYRSEETGSIGCPFREICSKSPQVRDKFLSSNFDKDPKYVRAA